jgi:phage protein D
MPPRTPYFRLQLEGEDITHWVNSVTVVECDKEADNVSISISDPRMIYSDCLMEGSTAEVIMGYSAPDEHAVMLKAVITKVELQLPESGIPRLTLKGEDRSIVMGIVEENRRWRDTTVNGIVSEIGDKHGFAAVEASLSPDPRIRNRAIHQDGKTDLAFLQELADKYKAKCFVELDEDGNEVLFFLPERQVVSSRSTQTIDLRYRTGPDANLISFSPSFNSSYIDRLKRIADVDVDGNEIENEDRTESEIFLWELDEERLRASDSLDESLIRSLYDAGAERKRNLQEQLIARRATVGAVVADADHIEQGNDAFMARRLGMTASGRTFGNAFLRAKSKINVKGVSTRFDGEWYVSNATHKIDGSKYTTEFKCVR